MTGTHICVSMFWPPPTFWLITGKRGTWLNCANAHSVQVPHSSMRMYRGSAISAERQRSCPSGLIRSSSGVATKCCFASWGAQVSAAIAIDEPCSRKETSSTKSAASVIITRARKEGARNADGKFPQ